MSAEPKMFSEAPSDLIRILVVDDDAQVRESYRRILVGKETTEDKSFCAADLDAHYYKAPQTKYTESAVELVMCSSGKSAVHVARRFHADEKPFTVIFMDIRMETELAGIVAAENIREFDKDAQVVFATAHMEYPPSEIVKRVEPLSNLFYIQKPFQAQEIQQFAISLSAKWRAEKELKALSKINLVKYKTLFETLPLGITVSDKDGKIVESNGTSELLLGLSKEEHERRRISGEEWRIIRPDGSDMPASEYASVIALKQNRLVENVEMGIVKDEGIVTWINVTASPVPVEGHGVVVVYNDITARMQAEKELVDREIFLDRIIEQSPFATWISDINGVLIRANETLKKSLNVTDEQIVGKYNILEDPRVEEAGHMDLVRSVFTEEKTVHFEMTWTGENTPFHDANSLEIEATLFPIFDSQHRLTNVVLNWIDIADRNKAEMALNSSEQRFRSLFNDVPISLWEEDFSDVLAYLKSQGFQNITDFDTYFAQHPEIVEDCASRVKVLAVNKATLDLHQAGSSKELLSGISKTFTKRSYEAFRRELVSICQGNMKWEEEAELKTLGGDIRHVVIRYSVPPDCQETLSRVFVSMADITKRTEFEFALRKSRAKLRDSYHHLQNVREEERTSIARDIHDDLGQTLTAMKMDISEIKNTLSTPDVSANEKLAKLELLTDEAIHSVQRVITDLRPSVLDHLGLVAAVEWQLEIFGARYKIQTNLDADLDDSNLDSFLATAMFRVLQESLTNVIRHAKADHVFISIEGDKDNILMKIQDNGVGISKNQVADPKSYGLIGIMERVEAWGGTVAFEGKPGLGTTVTVSIPRNGYHNGD